MSGGNLIDGAVATALVLLIAAAFELIRFVWFKRFKRKQWKLQIREDIGRATDADYWNVIEVRQSEIDGTKEIALDRNRLLNDAVILVRTRWSVRKHVVRVWQNPQGAEDTMKMHSRLSEALRLDLAGESTSVKFDVGLRRSVAKLLLPFFFHPDPSVRLQWNLGFLFLVLGFVVPKLLDPIVAKAWASL